MPVAIWSTSVPAVWVARNTAYVRVSHGPATGCTLLRDDDTDSFSLVLYADDDSQTVLVTQLLSRDVLASVRVRQYAPLSPAPYIEIAKQWCLHTASAEQAMLLISRIMSAVAATTEAPTTLPPTRGLTVVVKHGESSRSPFSTGSVVAVSWQLLLPRAEDAAAIPIGPARRIHVTVGASDVPVELAAMTQSMLPGQRNLRMVALPGDACIGSSSHDDDNAFGTLLAATVSWPCGESFVPALLDVTLIEAVSAKVLMTDHALPSLPESTPAAVLKAAPSLRDRMARLSLAGAGAGRSTLPPLPPRPMVALRGHLQKGSGGLTGTATSPRQPSPRQSSPRQPSPRQPSPRQPSPRQPSPLSWAAVAAASGSSTARPVAPEPALPAATAAATPLTLAQERIATLEHEVLLLRALGAEREQQLQSAATSHAESLVRLRQQLADATSAAAAVASAVPTQSLRPSAPEHKTGDSDANGGSEPSAIDKLLATAAAAADQSAARSIARSDAAIAAARASLGEAQAKIRELEGKLEEAQRRAAVAEARVATVQQEKEQECIVLRGEVHRLHVLHDEELAAARAHHASELQVTRTSSAPVSPDGRLLLQRLNDAVAAVAKRTSTNAARVAIASVSAASAAEAEAAQRAIDEVAAAAAAAAEAAAAQRAIDEAAAAAAAAAEAAAAQRAIDEAAAAAAAAAEAEAAQRAIDEAAAAAAAEAEAAQRAIDEAATAAASAAEAEAAQRAIDEVAAAAAAAAEAAAAQRAIDEAAAAAAAAAEAAAAQLEAEAAQRAIDEAAAAATIAEATEAAASVAQSTTDDATVTAEVLRPDLDVALDGTDDGGRPVAVPSPLASADDTSSDDVVASPVEVVHSDIHGDAAVDNSAEAAPHLPVLPLSELGLSLLAADTHATPTVVPIVDKTDTPSNDASEPAADAAVTMAWHGFVDSDDEGNDLKPPPLPDGDDVPFVNSAIAPAATADDTADLPPPLPLVADDGSSPQAVNHAPASVFDAQAASRRDGGSLFGNSDALLLGGSVFAAEGLAPLGGGDTLFGGASRAAKKSLFDE